MDRPTPANPALDGTPRLRVLASGSMGNCSVLCAPGATVLIDAGLSPRRTRRQLAEWGMTLDGIDAVLLTHLDSDHFHSGWLRALPGHVAVHVHAAHAEEAHVRGVARGRQRVFEEEVVLDGGVRARAMLTAHDELGTAAFRFEFDGGESLGFATDLGHATGGLVEHLRGVDVLAVESNYCPRMQVASDRPEILKRRVMGGRGHLSNQECVSLVAEAGPCSHVVLLHLSRECNDPVLVGRLHASQGYRVTITSQFEPTEWIEVRRGDGPVARAARPLVAGSLFDQLAVVEGRGLAP